MTANAFLETIVSLSLQVTLVVWVTALLVCWAKDERIGDRLWANCHLLVLFLTAAAVALPHLRLLPRSALFQHDDFARAARLQETFGSSCAYVLCIGASAALFALVVGILRAVRILRSSCPVPEVDLPADDARLVLQASGKLRSRAGPKSVQIRFSPDIRSPFCWQIHRPVIVLPEFVRRFPGDEFAAVIRHELGHLSAAHPLKLFLQRIVEALFWFHPLVWWASSNAAKYREFSCDATACGSRDHAAAYVRSLLRLAVHDAPAFSISAVGLPFVGRTSLIQQRTARILERFQQDGRSVRGQRRLYFGQLAAFVLVATLWVPLNVWASDRSLWSPWPRWSAQTLHTVGISVRDYEIDGHRVAPHSHERSPAISFGTDEKGIRGP